MFKNTFFAAIATIVIVSPALGAWDVIETRWRSDKNAFAETQVWEDFVWKEGWNNDEQFYPKYFKPAGSAHVVLRNRTDRTQTLQLLQIDGTPIDQIKTTPTRASELIYAFIEPQQVQPGAWTECIVRLRNNPKTDVKLTFQTGDGKLNVTVPIEPDKIRIESVSFSHKIDRLFVYLRALDGTPPQKGTLQLDGTRIEKNVTWTPGPAGSGLILAEAPLKPAWETGSFHLIRVDLPNGKTRTFPVRAWDQYFAIGLFGDKADDNVKDAKTHGIDTYYTTGPPPIMDELGLNYILVGSYGQGRSRTDHPSGRLFYYNMDEPDGRDCIEIKTLPIMERLGVHAELKVIPIIRQQRAADPITPNLLLANNTYKPLNYYVYGQLADIFCTDPYVPISAEQLERVPNSLKVARDACAPHPLTAVLWVTGNDGHRWAQRPPTPKEERIMVFHALGCGIKGLGYFADYDLKAEGGTFFPVSANKPLWDEVGKINRDVRVLADDLSVGCPIANDLFNRKVHLHALMCGADKIIAIAINKKHHIGYNTVNHTPFHFPAKNVTLNIPLPQHFNNCSIQEVRDGQRLKTKATFEAASARIHLDEVDTARTFIITNGS